jgi:hypothetical protein
MKLLKIALSSAIIAHTVALTAKTSTTTTSKTAAPVPTTITINNKSSLALYVLPDMAVTSLALINAGRPMAALLPANGLGIQFTYPGPVALVYILTPSAMAQFQEANPSAAPSDSAAIFGWIISQGKGTKDGVYSVAPDPIISVNSNANGSLSIN